MATDFKIRCGPASDLFKDPAVSVFAREVNPNLRIEVGCWYLTSDTAELFLGVRLNNGAITLKCINSENILGIVAGVEKELAKKLESGFIEHAPDGATEEVLVEGTALKIVVDAYTKAETVAKIEEKIADAIGSSDTGGVISKLNSYIATNDAAVAAIRATTDANQSKISDMVSTIAKLSGDVNTDGSIHNIVANAIADIPAATAVRAGLVKASSEIAVAADGSMSISGISTDKLVQGSGVLVLSGGCAEAQN